MYSLSQSYVATPVMENRGYSRLESLANSYQPSSVSYSAQALPVSSYHLAPISRPISYTASEHEAFSYQASQVAYHSSTHSEYHFVPDNFLRPGKGGKFVGRAEEVREFVEEAFEALFHTPFPEDVKISICDEQQFRTLAPHPSTIGLSLNRRSQGLLSEIFVLNDSLGRVMLTLGHELGHVLTETLENKHDEEAKAYAFSLVWMDVIKEHDIAGLGDAIILENPARNGLHDRAFEFVHTLLKEGKAIMQIYQELVKKTLSFVF